MFRLTQRNLRNYRYNQSLNTLIPQGLGFTRRRRRRKVINRRPPVVTTQPQRYGPGRLLTNITINTSPAVPNSVTSINLGESLKSNLEFTELIGKFNYMKLLGIRILLRPYLFTNSNNNYGVFVVNWHGEAPGDIEKSDNAKYFGPVNNNMKVWKFIPPKMVIGTTNSDSAPVDLSQYINTRRFVLPAWFHVYHTFPNTTFTFTVEMILETRGLTMLPASSKIDNLEKQLTIIKRELDKGDKMEIEEEIEGNKDKVEAPKESQLKINSIQQQIDQLKDLINNVNLNSNGTS